MYLLTSSFKKSSQMHNIHKIHIHFHIHKHLWIEKSFNLPILTLMIDYMDLNLKPMGVPSKKVQCLNCYLQNLSVPLQRSLTLSL